MGVCIVGGDADSLLLDGDILQSSLLPLVAGGARGAVLVMTAAAKF